MPFGKVTIAIPTLNRASYLRLAIISALAQTYEHLEVLVSDNTSTDSTQEMLDSLTRDPRLRVLHQPVKLSMVDNWNACVAASTGEYFLLLSDDDLLDPEAIAEMVNGFEQGPLPQKEVGVVQCRGRIIDENGIVTATGPSAPQVVSAEQMILDFFDSRRRPFACTLLFRRSDITEGYTARFPLCTDAAQWIQAVIKRGHGVFVDRTLASYRVHRNITAMTPIATWQCENLNLAEFVITQLKEAHLGSEQSFANIRRSVRRLNIRIVSDLLFQRYAGQRWQLLKAYMLHWRNFTSPYGLRCLKNQLLAPTLSGILGHVGQTLRRRSP